MSENEEKKAEQSGISESEVAIDKAELDKLKADADTLARISSKASDYNIEDPFEFVESIERIAVEKLDEAEEKKPPEPAKTPEAVEKTEIKPDEKPEYLKNIEARVDKSDMLAFKNMLSTHFTSFQVNNMANERQPSFKRKDLETKIMGPEGRLVANIAENKFDGNLFAAAEYVLTVEGGDVAARKEGAASEKAKSEAADSANLQPGGRAKTADTRTPEEKADEENKALADDICPDDDPLVFE